MNCNKKQGRVSPHKAVLLLAVMNELTNGRISDSFVPLSKDLEESFRKI